MPPARLPVAVKYVSGMVLRQKRTALRRPSELPYLSAELLETQKKRYKKAGVEWPLQDYKSTRTPYNTYLKRNTLQRCIKMNEALKTMESQVFKMQQDRFYYKLNLMLVQRNNARVLAERMRNRMAAAKVGKKVVAVAKGKKKDDNKKKPAQRKQK
eukprot:RCo009062